MDTIARQPRPLGQTGQQPLLKLRRRVKTQALALCRWAALHGIRLRELAARIGVAEQTISDWWNQRAQCQLDTASRGRPPHLLSPEQEDHVRELLGECRGRLGLPFLKDAFADVPRTTLQEIRQAYQSEHDRSTEHLTWTQPGRVWAADFTEPEVPVDGVYPYILSVRDLASSYQLLILPARHADAQTTVMALKYLFTAFGPPLVLKTDNGSHFTADPVLRLLFLHKVMHLTSPPMTPRYNGSIEAGIAAAKTRAIRVAAAFDRPDCWTGDDLEAARLEANHQARPWGINGPSPEEKWTERKDTLEPERTAFIAAVASTTHDEAIKMINQIQAHPGYRPAAPLNASERATVARPAIRRALVDLGFLFVRRTAT